MDLTARQLFAELDCYDEPIPLDVLKRHVQRLRASRADLRRFAKFGDHCYQRNLMHTGPAYQALVLCWRSGQRSPIHDHRGSACAVRVIEGVGTETLFELSPCGLIYATQSRQMTPGMVTVSFDADIHQMGNLQPARQDLITLHIYSPPLLTMRTYFLGDSVLGECGDAVRAAIRARANHLGQTARSPASGPDWRLPAKTRAGGPPALDDRKARAFRKTTRF